MAGPDGGARAHLFSLPDVRSQQPRVRLADLLASHRPVLLNFWASTCIPCVKELPLLEAGHRQAGDRVVFLGVDEEDERSGALSLLGRTGVTYDSAYDRDGALSDSYSLRGLPTTVGIGADGRILGRVLGPLSRDSLDDVLARLEGVSRGNGP